MISVQSVDEHLYRLAQPVDSVLRPLRQAAGRCLREALVARRPAPPFDRVMMDGYALKAGAFSAEQRRFRIVGRAPAGAEPSQLPDGNCAVEVMTGAVLPPGADCVVPVEVCRVTGDTLEVQAHALLEAGQFIHACGSEYPEGAQILPEGLCLHSAHLALTASEGYADLRVNADLAVHLITTGDEIVETGCQPMPWQIFGTHAAVIEAALSTAADVSLQRQHVHDALDELVAAIEACGDDPAVFILCGAMSKGRKDYGIRALEQCGFELIFHRVAQRPGHPMALARRGRSLLFGLPGNPLAVLFTFYRHVLPTLDRLRACPPKEPVRVRLASELPSLAEATRFVPCRLQGGQAVLRLPNNSGDLQCLAGSDGFVEIPPENAGQSGEAIRFWPWR